ncbi:ABC transporter permease [Chloroflexota bacterium]
MMLANVFTKSVRDRWRGTMIAFVSLMLMLLFAMSIYRNFDINIYQDMPEALKTIMGIPANADVASLAISVFLSGAGAWVLAGLTIASGSASIASEESNGTIGLLLGNPRSRTNVLLSKAAAMILLMFLLVAASWGTTYLIANMLGVNIGETRVAALSLHLFSIALFHGFLAIAIGAWTGNRGMAAGATTGVMFVSIFAVGLLPLIEGWENVAKVFPWYYLNGSEPLLNGTDWGHIGILFGGIVVFAVVALFGLNRRDLKNRNVGVTLIDRLRNYPATQKIISRLAGSTRVSRIWIKTFSEHQTLLSITGYVMFLTAVLIGVLYNFMPMETMTNLIESFPEAEVIFAAIGGGTFNTPEGFFQLEIFGLMAPAALMIVGIKLGAGALSGEESHHTMGLLLANPIPRHKVILEKSLAMVICAIITGIATFAGVVAGSLLGRLGMDIGNIAATCLLVTLLGLVFGALALALSAATGQGKIAVFGSIGVALVSYITSSFLPLSESLAGYAKWSPYYYFLGSDPLVTGMDWGHGAILAGITLGLVVLSIVLFQRRDLR